MNNQHYFPPLSGKVDCSQCEAEDCRSRDKHQRNRRDFTHTSGRCPRLPDLRGFVERDEREVYAAAFMLIHAELGAGGLQLTLTIPGQKRYRKVYLTKSGYWYFNTRSAEGYVRLKLFEAYWKMTAPAQDGDSDGNGEQDT